MRSIENTSSWGKHSYFPNMCSCFSHSPSKVEKLKANFVRIWVENTAILRWVFASNKDDVHFVAWKSTEYFKKIINIFIFLFSNICTEFRKLFYSYHIDSLAWTRCRKSYRDMCFFQADNGHSRAVTIVCVTEIWYE